MQLGKYTNVRPKGRLKQGSSAGLSLEQKDKVWMPPKPSYPQRAPDKEAVACLEIFNAQEQDLATQIVSGLLSSLHGKEHVMLEALF